MARSRPRPRLTGRAERGEQRQWLGSHVGADTCQTLLQHAESRVRPRGACGGMHGRSRQLCLAALLLPQLLYAANCTLPGSTDPSTRAECTATHRSLLFGCECDACRPPYELIGSRLCPLCPIMPPYRCFAIAHCEKMEFCTDCGCTNHWCCERCDANWTAVGSGSQPDECVCKPPRHAGRNGTCS